MQYDFYGLSGGNAASSPPQGFQGIVFIVALAMLLLQLRTRRVRPVGLVVMPVLMLAITIPLVFMEPVSPAGLAALALGLAMGAGIGAAIGSMMEVRIDERDGSMLLRGSIVAMLAWAAVIGLKLYGKGLLAGFGLVDAGLLTSAFLMITIGMMIARRAIVYWRYLQMKKPAPATGNEN